ATKRAWPCTECTSGQKVSHSTSCSRPCTLRWLLDALVRTAIARPLGSTAIKGPRAHAPTPLGWVQTTPRGVADLTHALDTAINGSARQWQSHAEVHQFQDLTPLRPAASGVFC